MIQQTARSDVRILIIEDHALFSESLGLALSIEGYDVRRVSLATIGSSSGNVVVNSATRLAPRIALLDLDLGALGDGTRFISPLVRGGIHVVVITGSVDKARWGEALRHGARAVLPKTRPLNDILATVRRINQGMPVMDRVEREQLIQLGCEQRERVQVLVDRMQLLTPRERVVLSHLMKGHQVREIASQGVVSEATVRTQVKSILAKLEVSSQLGAVGMAHEIGWNPLAVAG